MEQVLHPIGAGGFGTVYARADGTVLKAIYTKKACAEARLEAEKQARAHAAFSTLEARPGGEPIHALVARYVRVAEPLEHSDAAFVLHGHQYACYVRMTRLHGLPLALYEAFDAALVARRFTPDYLAQMRADGTEIMAHLALNSDIAGFYGREYSATRISERNPPRGYFATRAHDGLLDYLRAEAGLRLSNAELDTIIGFVYGRLFSVARIAPVDIEITLGYDPVARDYCVNVLDFGMTFDLLAPHSSAASPRAADFFALMAANPPGPARDAALLDAVLADIDIDLYGAISDRADVRAGFDAALTRCATCGLGGAAFACRASLRLYCGARCWGQ